MTRFCSIGTSGRCNRKYGIGSLSTVYMAFRVPKWLTPKQDNKLPLFCSSISLGRNSVAWKIFPSPVTDGHVWRASVRIFLLLSNRSRAIRERPLGAGGEGLRWKGDSHCLLGQLFVLLSFLLVVVAEIVLHAVDADVQALVDLLAIDAVLRRAGTHPGWRRGSGFGVGSLGLLFGFAQGLVGLGIEIGSGFKTEFLLEAGIGLDAHEIGR